MNNLPRLFYKFIIVYKLSNVYAHLKIYNTNKSIYYPGDVNMPDNPKFPNIDMELYETDIDILQNFIATVKTDGQFTQDYLILYDFATDLKYQEYINPGLIKYLLPFYLKTIEEAAILNNKTAMDIYCAFNEAVFFNKQNFISATGDKAFNYIMEYYIEQTIKKMEMQYLNSLSWISLFNTASAFCDNNIQRLFYKICNGDLKVKFSFFKYLCILLFKESDNLLINNKARAYWTSSIWDFDDSGCGHSFFWNSNTINFFNKQADKNFIKTLLEETKHLVYKYIGKGSICLFCEEMEKSFSTGIFYSRKKEFLEKISSIPKKELYWNNTF